MSLRKAATVGWRRWKSAVFAALLAAVLMPIAATTPAQAAISPNFTGTGGGCSGFVESGFHWSQRACIAWVPSDRLPIHGSTDIQFETGFNRDHVISCTYELTLVYPDQSESYMDVCTDAAKRGGKWSSPVDHWGVEWGPGPYSIHSCVNVLTVVTTYTSCPSNTPHPASPVLHVS
jgi:hypothetical protein